MPRPPLTLLACLAIAAGGAIAGCGSDDDDGGSGSATPPPPAASASSADEAKVTMKDIEYVPAAITVKVGQKIVWENTDGDIPHTVTATEGADFDSGNMKPGDTFEYTPKQAGKIDYVCTIHPDQTGEVTVEE